MNTFYQKDNIFGEIGFFGDTPRICSVKSADYTDTYVINRSNFLNLADFNVKAIVKNF